MVGDGVFVGQKTKRSHDDCLQIILNVFHDSRKTLKTVGWFVLRVDVFTGG